MELQPNKRLVFIGDSITEWGRHDGDHIGTGYVRFIHDYLITTYPDRYPEMINRGVGGDRITNLQARWKRDVIDLNPDFLSISIGINDVWRQLDHNQDPDQVYPDRFEEIYIDLLTQVKEKTKAKIILMEPTVIEEDIHAEGNQKLIPYVELVQKLVKDFDAIHVPTHQAFIQYLKLNTTGYKLTSDGVHMNSAGNVLMANTWIKSFEQFLK